MKKLDGEAEKIMVDRFGKDTVIALATSAEGVPHVRYVNAYYEDGAFYIVTYALSNKMRQIEDNPAVAIAGEWFTAHGRAACLGPWGADENRVIAGKLRKAFESWIDNGHNDLGSADTVIIRVELTDGLLLSYGVRYEF